MDTRNLESELAGAYFTSALKVVNPDTLKRFAPSPLGARSVISSLILINRIAREVSDLLRQSANESAVAKLLQTMTPPLEPQTEAT